MAAFSDIGAHCAVATCHQQDFLPFRCEICLATYCLDHRSTHACTVDRTVKNTMPKCPLCGMFVKIAANENPDAVMDLHIKSGCKVSLLDKESENKKVSCSMAHCKRKELIPITCPSCKLTFCIQHRSDLDHNCVKVSKTSNLGISNSSVAAKQNPVAKKPLPPHIKLMQLKSRAIGASVEEVNRVCYEIVVQPVVSTEFLSKQKIEQYNKQPCAVNLSKSWTVGKCLDSVCNAIGIPNRNNELNSRKVCLSMNNGTPLPNDLELNLLLSEIPSGSTLLLAFA